MGLRYVFHVTNLFTKLIKLSKIFMSENTNEILRLILTEAVKIAQEEGVTGEEQISVRANEIKEDALLDEPKTEAGKRAKEASAVKSPYVQPKFDYDLLRDQTSNVAVRKLFETITKYKNLVIPMKQVDSDGKKAIEDDYQACTLEMFKILNESGVGIGEYKYVFRAMGAVINSLEGIMMKQVDGHRTEINSRMLGAKNPGTDKFDQRHATYKHLTDLLEKVRKETGDKREDYFEIEPFEGDQ